MHIPFLNKNKVGIISDPIKITKQSSSFQASSDNKIIEYEIKGKCNKVMVKDVGCVSVGRTIRPLPENTIYYEVAIADLMKKLNLKAVKKMLICDFVKDPKKNYVVSEWEDELNNYSSAMIWKGKMLNFLATYIPLESLKIKYWLALYKQEGITPQQKEFYKMCTCLVAVGMLDLKPGDNIMENKEGFPVAVDTGFSYFTDEREGYKFEEWQECVDILKNHKDEEVNKWGNLIQGYKDYILNIAEQKNKTILNFTNIVEKTGEKRCEINMPEKAPPRQNKVVPYSGQITSKPCNEITSSSKALA